MRWPFVEQAKNKHVIVRLQLLLALYVSVEQEGIVLDGELDAGVVRVSAPALSSATSAPSAAVRADSEEQKRR